MRHSQFNMLFTSGIDYVIQYFKVLSNFTAPGIHNTPTTDNDLSYPMISG